MKILQNEVSKNHQSAMFYDGIIATCGEFKLETFQSGKIVFNDKFYSGNEIIKLIEHIDDDDINDDVDILVDKFFIIIKKDKPVNEEKLIYTDYSEALKGFSDFMTNRQKKQTEHYLNSFIELANTFFNENNMELYNYWKGQVFGITKMCTLLELNIDTKYYLNLLY